MKSISLIILIILMSILSCVNRKDGDNMKIENTSNYQSLKPEHAVLDEELLLGYWILNLEDGPVFYIDRDSIDFLSENENQKYKYLVRKNRIIIYTNEFIYPDSIKNGDYVLTYDILKLVPDTLILDRYNTPLIYKKVTGTPFGSIKENSDVKKDE